MPSVAADGDGAKYAVQFKQGQLVSRAAVFLLAAPGQMDFCVLMYNPAFR